MNSPYHLLHSAQIVVWPYRVEVEINRISRTLKEQFSTVIINKTDELKRRDVTPEQFDEHLNALVWCLPKTYNMEKPPFVGKNRKYKRALL